VIGTVWAMWDRSTAVKPPAAPLSATDLYGEIKLEGSQEPVAFEQEIKPKQKLKVGKASRLEISTRRGGRVKLQSPMDVTIDKLYDDEASLELTCTKGYVYASFMKKGEVVVNYGKYVVKGNQCAFSMEEDQEGKYQVICDSGRLTVTLDTGPTEIGQGDSVVLP
jgi:hypothetical protein